jgi:GNAT superfamily N-acetyltransferase
VEVTARPAIEADLPSLVALFEAGVAAAGEQRGSDLWRLEWAPRPPFHATVRQRLTDPDAGTLAGCIDDVPVGALLLDRRVVPDGPTVARVTFVYVDPQARDVGVGEALIDAAAMWARAMGCTGLDGLALPGDRHLKNLYERAGMTAREITVFRELAP